MNNLVFKYFSIGSSVFLRDQYGCESIIYQCRDAAEATQKANELQNLKYKTKRTKNRVISE